MSATTAPSVRHAALATPIGELTFVRDDAGYTGIWFPGHWTNPDRTRFGARAGADDPDFADAVTQFGQYFGGERRTFDLPLNPHGTSLAHRVWDLLAAIPYGATTTYGALAGQVGVHARAVGQFVGHNPLSIVVPCHRVVGSTGKLTGYAGGLERKQFLLELEGAISPSSPGLW